MLVQFIDLIQKSHDLPWRDIVFEIAKVNPEAVLAAHAVVSGVDPTVDKYERLLGDRVYIIVKELILGKEHIRAIKSIRQAIPGMTLIKAKTIADEIREVIMPNDGVWTPAMDVV